MIFDEISRCRPDIQNKLFPIIHERRAQGILLDGLRYRWAAMNPPVSEDQDGGYIGSEPLDPALADRFAFIVNMPPWDRYNEDEQLAIILADDRAVPAGSASNFQRVIASTKAALPSIRGSMADAVAEETPVDPTAIRPFEIAVPDAVLEDLQTRLERTRLPDQLDGAGWDYGAELGYLTALITYWRDEFDWREQERRLNQFDQYRTVLDDLDIHFIHHRSPEADALPLIITHG